jgi:hypothetical protein
MVADLLVELTAETVEQRRKKRMTATSSAYNGEASAGEAARHGQQLLATQIGRQLRGGRRCSAALLL